LEMRQGRSASSWIAMLVGGMFVVLSAISLSGQLIYSLRGVPGSGQVIEFHKSQARSQSIDAQVVVHLPGVAPFPWDVDDALGIQHWEVGGSVPLVCAHVHADHISCVVDSWWDRFLLPSIMLVIGAAAMVWAVAGRSRTSGREMGVSNTAGR
jgi:hypothetical protein